MEKNNKQPVNTPEEKLQKETGLPEKQPIERSKFVLVWLAVVILFGLVAGSFWFLQQQLNTQKLKTTILSQDASSAEQLQNKVSLLEQSVNTAETTTEQRLTGLDTANVSLLDKVDELSKAEGLTNDDVLRSWVLAELKFLLQSANQSTLLAGDVDKARAALALADQQLKVLTDPRLHELRALIADEQLALASVAKVDVDGLAMQLRSAINRVDDLHVLMDPEINQQDGQNTAAETLSSQTWQTTLSHVWQEIKSLVVIRHQQDAAVAVLVPEQRYFLYQNLRLKLESANLALLSAKETTFHDNLTSAEQWLQQYFIGPERDAMVDMLQNMKSETIVVDMPDISASLVWLRHYGDQQ